jgi:hypothetical protein
MPSRAGIKKKRPRDANQLAYQIVQESTGQAPHEPPDTRNRFAVALSKLGTAQRGKVRAATFNPTSKRCSGRRLPIATCMRAGNAPFLSASSGLTTIVMLTFMGLRPTPGMTGFALFEKNRTGEPSMENATSST